MTYSTVEDARHRASDAGVKTVSAFGQTPRKRRGWLRGKTQESAPAVTGARSTFPNPDADTRILPQIGHSPAACALPPVHRDQSTNPDQVAINMIAVCAQSLREHWSSTRLMDTLLTHNGELHRRSMREQEGGAAIHRRTLAAQQAAMDAAAAIAAVVDAEERAKELGIPFEAKIDPGALGAGLAAMTANAHAPERGTMQFPKLTDDVLAQMDAERGVTVQRVPATATSDPAAVPSPVHTGRDETAPPVPAVDDEDTDPGAAKPLPKRVPQTIAYGESSQVVESAAETEAAK